MLTALLITQLHPAFSIQAEDWLRVAGVFALSALYLTSFFTLGLLVSVIANRPATALALLLQAWIILIVLYPNVAVVASRQLVSLPSEEEIDYRKREIQSRFDPRLRAVYQEMQSANAAGKAATSEVMIRWTDLMAEDAEAKHQPDVELSNARAGQARVAGMLLSISPASLYDRSAARLARTGMEQHDRFLDAAGRYWREYIEATKARWRALPGRADVKRPEFTYPSEPLADSLAGTTVDILVLALVSLILFTLTTTLFLRKDVR
jgi:ABC-type transport system involved in multi-copper enzyme maturation permease subunit